MFCRYKCVCTKATSVLSFTLIFLECLCGSRNLRLGIFALILCKFVNVGHSAEHKSRIESSCKRLFCGFQIWFVAPSVLSDTLHISLSTVHDCNISIPFESLCGTASSGLLYKKGEKMDCDICTLFHVLFIKL